PPPGPAPAVGPPASGPPPPGEAPADLTGDLSGAAPLVPPEIVAQSMREYLHGAVLRIRGGESGMLPVIMGLIITAVVFQVISPHHIFLSAGNIVNLFQQSAVFMVLAMAETFALLLGEIDLSIGFVGVVGAAIAVQLVQPTTTNWPWWAAIVVALLACALIGAAQGSLITRLRLPSFIVTLAGLLIFNGVLLIVLAFGPFSGYPTLTGSQPNLRALYNLMWGHISPTQGWIVMAVIVGALGLNLWMRDARRRRSGLVAPPVGLTV